MTEQGLHATLQPAECEPETDGLWKPVQIQLFDEPCSRILVLDSLKLKIV